MSELLMTNAQIKDLIEAFKSADLGEISLSQGDFKIKISAKQEVSKEIVYAQAGATTMQCEIPVTTAVDEVKASTREIAGTLVKAPIVGTFYDAPAPDKESFVKIGQRVKKGEVLFIIESMKLMNEIQSDIDGEVVEILISTGTPVEYDQPILRIL